MEFIRDPELDHLISIEDRARELLDEYGLDNWTFEISSEKVTVGHCYHDRKLIVFSENYAHADWSEIEDTILHEIAHALVGPGHGHNLTWKLKAMAIGAKPERLAPPHLQSKAEYRYVMECPNCGKQWHRYRMRRRNFGSICPTCKVEVDIYELRR